MWATEVLVEMKGACGKMHFAPRFPFFFFLRFLIHLLFRLFAAPFFFSSPLLPVLIYWHSSAVNLPRQTDQDTTTRACDGDLSLAGWKLRRPHSVKTLICGLASEKLVLFSEKCRKRAAAGATFTFPYCQRISVQGFWIDPNKPMDGIII